MLWHARKTGSADLDSSSSTLTLDLKTGFQTQDPKKIPQVLDPEKTDAYTTSKILDLKKQAVIANYW